MDQKKIEIEKKEHCNNSTEAMDETKIITYTALISIALRNVKKVNALLINTIKNIIEEWRKLF